MTAREASARLFATVLTNLLGIADEVGEESVQGGASYQDTEEGGRQQ